MGPRARGGRHRGGARPAAALLLAAALLVAGAAACGRAAVADRERAAVARSARAAAAARAKEAAWDPLPRGDGGVLGAAGYAPLGAPPPRPAAPRIWLEFQLQGFSANATAGAQITSDAMPTAARVLQKLFKVQRPVAGALQLPGWWAAPGATCIDAAINRDTVAGYGPGRAADYILYVTSVPCEAGTVAYAGACAVGGPDSRPVMGAINLCPGAYERLPPGRQVEVTVHELLHAFVSGGGLARGRWEGRGAMPGAWPGAAAPC
jgi:hypothetical protein